MRFDPRSLLLAAVTTASGLAVVLTTPQTASAWPPYYTEWKNIYPSSTTDDAIEAEFGVNQGCAVCHFSSSGGVGWNPYGWDVRKKLLGGLTIHDAILAAALWDSEDNPKSWSNITEITAGTQPGWTPGLNNIEYTDFTTTTGLPSNPTLAVLDPAASPMIPMCDPGAAGVLACPCGNPSNGLNRGCENSLNTTGAALHATGVASLSADTLQLKTGGERPTSLSIIAQWNGVDPAGVVFGMGVRCTAGSLKRLYSRNAVGGSVTAPTGLDLPVAAQSAAKGDPISAGQNRWYVVYYRDPVVLGGCPPNSNFNSTATGQVTWAP